MIYICNSIRRKRIIINEIETDYDILETGEVYSYKSNRFLYGGYDEDGYIHYEIYVSGRCYIRKAHRLVAEYFLDNIDPINLTDVNHINGIKWCNFYKNLEYCTSLYNTHHACENNLRYSILNRETVKLICEDISKGNIRCDEIANKYKIPYSSVIKIKNGVNWKSISEKYDFSKYKFTRGSNGEKNGNSSITEKDAIQICKLLKSGISPTDISKTTNIPRSIIYKIKNGKTWRKVYNDVVN